tara:strand:+ start:115 stop:348 length:234 start_codon:yes stop_codon:yes gene_type:complete
MTKVSQKNYWTITFNVDPDLNDGYQEVFKQGDEPWWWHNKGAYVDHEGGPAVGPTPDFTGASFKSLHNNSTLVLGED